MGALISFSAWYGSISLFMHEEIIPALPISEAFYQYVDKII